MKSNLNEIGNLRAMRENSTIASGDGLCNEVKFEFDPEFIRQFTEQMNLRKGQAGQGKTTLMCEILRGLKPQEA